MDEDNIVTRSPDWNPESGDWQDLEADSQTPRYSEIARLIKEFLHHDAPTILDVGCGMGLLARHLPWCHYTGVEPSVDAVAQARSKFPGLHIVNSTAESFDSDSLSDGVILSEMLYYARDPVALIRKFSTRLNANGVVIVTIYIKPGQPGLRQILRHVFDWSRPYSNSHCSRLVEDYLSQHGRILRKSEVQIPGTAQCWRVWAWSPETT